MAPDTAVCTFCLAAIHLLVRAITGHLQITCTGNEDRLEDCLFPDGFGQLDNFDRSACLQPESRRLGVVCRTFEITGAMLPKLVLPCILPVLKSVSTFGAGVSRGTTNANPLHKCTSESVAIYRIPAKY